MKKFFSVSLCLCGLLFFSTTWAQIKFQRTYGGSGHDEGRSVKQTWDGGYIIAGTTSSFGAGATDVYLLKVDSLGNVQWQKTFGGNNIDRGYSLDITSDSGFVICGYTNSFGFGGYDIYLIRTDQNGDTLWTKTYGGTDWDFGFSVQQTLDGGFILAGGTYSYGNGDEDVFVVKTNAAGDTLWTKAYGGNSQDEAAEVIETSDSVFVALGISVDATNTNEDIYLLKMSQEGDTVWTKKYGGAGKDFGKSIKESLTHQYEIVGYTNSSTAGDYNELSMQTDTSGNVVGAWDFGGPNNEIMNYVAICSSGWFASCGRFDGSGGGGFDMRFTKLQPDGWAPGPWPTFGGLNYDEAFHVEETSDHGFIIVGVTQSFVNFTDRIFLVKLDSVLQTGPSVVNEVLAVNTIEVPQKNCVTVKGFSGEIAFSILQNISEGRFKIFDSQGRCLRSYRQSGVDEIKINDLATGIYFYSLTAENGFTCTGKFAVIKR
jgi:hypothetical protein